MFFLQSEEIFNPDVIDCCIDIGGCRQDPPDDLVELLTGKPLSECERIIKEYQKPKEKLVVKWPRKIGFVTAGDNR
jgi:hypothetical protein